MKHIIALTAAATSLAIAAEPPAQDRHASLAMAGTHGDLRVPGNRRHRSRLQAQNQPYEAPVTEVVIVGGLPGSHCPPAPACRARQGRQAPSHQTLGTIATWQDTESLDHRGSEDDHHWNTVTLTPEQAAGTWTQLVTNIDDTPRYEGYGQRTHENGESLWQSHPTRRPLPRREYWTRDDYDYLIVTNRHRDSHRLDPRTGQPQDRGSRRRGKHLLCFETGMNTYTRTEPGRRNRPRMVERKPSVLEHCAEFLVAVR